MRTRHSRADKRKEKSCNEAVASVFTGMMDAIQATISSNEIQNVMLVLYKNDITFLDFGSPGEVTDLGRNTV